MNVKRQTSNDKRVVVIMGPTGVGKSAVAARVAKKLGGEIICADSRQIYREIPIASGQPTSEEKSMAPHHLYEVLDPTERCSAGAFREMALPIIDAIAMRGKLPILVGGTGLYVRAAISEWTLAPIASNASVQKLEERIRREGSELMWKEMARLDPEAARRIHQNDAYRIVRTMAVWSERGRGPTSFHTPSNNSEVRTITMALRMDRTKLYARINARCGAMMDAGLMSEAKNLRDRGLATTLPALRAIGCRECFSVLEGGMSIDQAVALLQQGSRRYAKRQMTWLRGQRSLIWIESRDVEETVMSVCAHVTRSLNNQ